jgi:uncharacterized repeat protein (TIGR02543 family)
MTFVSRSLIALCISVAAWAAIGPAPAFAAGNAIKVSGAPSTVKYGSRVTATVSGHGERVGGVLKPYPPNTVIVDELTSASPQCPKRLGLHHQGNLRQILSFHSAKTTQVLKHFSRGVAVNANGSAYGLCAFLLNFPSGQTYAHAGAYWTVTGAPPPPTMYTLTVSTSGTSGEVESSDLSIECGSFGNHCVHSYAPGTTVTLTESSQPEPPVSSTFAGWGGACSGTDPTCTVTMDSDKTVTATFMPTP